MDNVYVVMPAYNEEENIANVISQWYPVIDKIGNGSKFVIVDDGSKDATFEKMQSLKSKYPLLVPITKINSGHGATCTFAYDYAIKNNADYIFQTDSDGQTEPDEFWQFWELRNEYDFIIGSRKKRKDGFSRIIVAKVLKLFVFFMMGVFIEDANTPFRLMKRSVLEKYFKLIPDNFFLSNVLISCIFILKNEKCKWIPITFKGRQSGTNSINLIRIFVIGLKSIRDFKIAKTNINA
ncbi:MAG: glycosyltransferase family 2 protein [Bacteroidales bacterium]|nr:glycosyltransferase family 2 protein [Bacteroidales bacterium]